MTRIYVTQDGQHVPLNVPAIDDAATRPDPLHVAEDDGLPYVVIIPERERRGYITAGFVGAILGAIVTIGVLMLMGYVGPVETASIVEPVIPVVAQETSMPRRAVEATNGNLERRSTPLSMSSIGTPLEGVRGTATWYDNGPGLYAAAGPGLRTGHWRGRVVSVCDPAACVTVRLTDWCACPHHLIDLSPSAFSSLAPLSRGVVGVVVSWGSPALPATDR